MRRVSVNPAFDSSNEILLFFRTLVQRFKSFSAHSDTFYLVSSENTYEIYLNFNFPIPSHH